MLFDIILLIVLIICLITDLTVRKIYNFILLPPCIAALVFHFVSGGLLQGLWSLQGLIFGIALLFIPFVLGGIGAGDVKLLGVIGVLKGPDFVLKAFLAGAIAGGVLSVLQLIRHRKLSSALKKLAFCFYLPIIGVPCVKEQSSTIADTQKGETIPYGAAIAIGATVAYFVR